MKEVVKRSITGLLLVIVISGAILTGPWTFLVILVAVNALSFKEILQAYPVKQRFPGAIMAISSLLLLPFSYMALEHQWNLFWGILLAALWLSGFILSGFPVAGTLILFWLSLPFCTFYLLGWLEGFHAYRPLYPFAVISMVWVNDTFAYVVGRSFGRHKLIPEISPEKTWEGFAGGLLFCLVLSWLLYRITGQFSMIWWLISGVTVSILALGGDLFESRLKRRLSVKNMGGLLPGHGGMLDRFDSLLFVSPAMLVLFYLLVHRA